MDDFLIWLGLSSHLTAALHLDTLQRLLLAAVLGGVVGMEREVSGKPAGLRTNLLICMGAALVAELSMSLAAIRGDPGRMVAQVVSGIGFIGAGTIIQSRGQVRGLTTAATIWVVAAIGMAVGLRAYVQAIGAAILVLVALYALRWLERLFARGGVKRRYRVALKGGYGMDQLLEAVTGMGLVAQVEEVERSSDGVELLVRLAGPAARHDELMPRLSALDGVRRARRG